MSADAWIRVLPGPPTPDGWSPPPGPRVAWPLRGVVTQPFGCTGFQLEHPATGCPNGFHAGVDIAEPEGEPVHAAASGLAYPLQDPARYGNFVIVTPAKPPSTGTSRGSTSTGGSPCRPAT